MTAAAPAATATQRSIAIVSAPGDASGDAVSAFVTQLGLVPAAHAALQGAGDAASLEALEAARGAEYAIVLASGDGNGISPLQIGFLLGLVGRNRLCFLGGAKVAGLEALPRHALDDSGLWRLLLAREMKQSGLDVDLNRAM